MSTPRPLPESASVSASNEPTPPNTVKPHSSAGPRALSSPTSSPSLSSPTSSPNSSSSPGTAPASSLDGRSAQPRNAPAGDTISRDVQAAPAGVSGSLRWIWPTDRVGPPRSVPGGGVLLSGRLGQDVRAANAGRVVYAGNGLRGYGNLIIIKHAESLLSAYAHNREILVHDGQEVAIGQVIAHMGEGPQRSPILYFEIRQNGRPVDPLPFLPKAR